MASSSSSGNMALSRANGSKYDLFLSFRGEDTRHSFTDHLYNALKQKGILTFRDSDHAERGEELKEEIEKAIKASDASIIVLSGNYASSTWCLDELSLILDQRRDCNHFVLPVFYHVDPSHVGKQEESFKIAASSSRRRWTDDNVKRWKAALTEVVSVIGMSLVGSENTFIKEVVDTIYNRLDRKQIYIPRNITGMDARYAEITSWLSQYENQFLVIYGMAGSGKSTLARYIVNSNCQHFECYSIVDSIDSNCEKPCQMVMLQQQLCDDISKGKTTRIPSLCQGTPRIEVLLEKKKALILLDDIVEVGQLDDLLGCATINKESKIIITTHSDIISDWFKFKSERFQKYRMRLLNDDEALELLSLHAFRSKIPKDGYNELAQRVVRYCDGSPLALEVLGSSLFHIDNITYWESELSSYEKSFNDKIDGVLKRSYASIPSIPEKDLFLHIACFFVGKDMNYVVKILKPDYPAAESKIETLIKRCFLDVTPDKKLMMHRLLQEMGRNLVDRESRRVVERTRVWRNRDSYHMLRSKKSSDTMEGLALDIQMLMKEDNIEPKELSTDSLQQMYQLKYLQLNYVKLTGSYEDLSQHIRWLCWVGFDKSTVHADILTKNIVALDMSYSCLEKFEPPTEMSSLKILNLKDSYNLLEIRSMDKIPILETLIISNCHNLFHISRGVGDLKCLSVLIMTGCKKLFKRERINTSVELETSTSGGEWAHELSFPLPHSLQRVLLNECNLECTDYFPLSFTHQFDLQYINMGDSLFESLRSYNHLQDLRVLDLRKCSRLKRLVRLPSTLAELYIYDCTSIEKISFESGRFTLQEFGYEGCINLSEIEGLAKLLLLAKLDETDLGHLAWLKEYHNHEVCLIGDYQLTKGRSCRLQMLYEFNIMSTSLPDIIHRNLMPDYRSQSTSLSFQVPACPRSSRLKGLNVTFRYTISGDDSVWFAKFYTPNDRLWFAKINTTNGVDLMYSPIVFGKPGIDQVGIWLSYWPIGNLLDVGDEVKVSIDVMSGLEILECGASLVYTDDNVASEILKNKTGWVETFGRDLSGFQLINGSYYLCQRDIYKIMEIGRLTSGWLSILVGDTIDDTEVRGWRMTGRPQQSYQLFTELKTGRYVIRGHEMEETGKFVDKIMMLEPPTLTDRMKSATTFVSTDTETKITITQINHLRIPLDEILEATKNFSKENIIAKGDFGYIYEGQLLRSGEKINISARRLDRSQGLGDVEFWTEISVLSGLKHPNIVSLIGFCDEKGEKIIINSHEANGCLGMHISDPTLTWIQRLIIAIGVAEAISYIHNEKGRNYSIIHRNINSSTILLDDNFEPKLSGFEFSLKDSTGRRERYISSEVVGIKGYMDPETMSGYVTQKLDIYSFGAVLCEIMCGRKAYLPNESEDNKFLAPLVKIHTNNNTLRDILISDMWNHMIPESCMNFAELALQCLGTNPITNSRTMEISLYFLRELLRKQLPTVTPDFPFNSENDVNDALLLPSEVVTIESTSYDTWKVNNLDHLRIGFIDIQLATNNFSKESELWFDDGYDVYKGDLECFDRKYVSSLKGKHIGELPKRRYNVRIMRIKDALEVSMFYKEIEILSTCKHDNIDFLLGFCDEGSQTILVYEGNNCNFLTTYLSSPFLTWDIRLKICLDVAHGLNYIHNEMEDQKMVIHRQLSTYCILLDGKPKGTKITGFGLSTFRENQDEDALHITDNHLHPWGVFSMAPEFSETGKATKESDIYSFGLVMFEILCGLQYLALRLHDHEFRAEHWFKDKIIKQKVAQVLWKENHGNKLFFKKGPNEDSLDTFINITEQCLAANLKQRPTLQVIIEQLEKALLFQDNHKDHLRMSFKDIEAATQNFGRANYIGVGGFGKVYRGELTSEHGSSTIVAKRLDTRSGQGDQQFYNELHILSEYKHENVIGLVGYNNDEQERIIVYEYASKGSLDKYLNDASLTWINRLNICIDVARGLAFLHAGVREHEAVIHRDMKPENILLFDDWKAKVADFGLSLIYTKNEENEETDYVIDHVSGTRGYLDPVYQNSRFLTKESDIYSLGVVFFEILYGKSTYEIKKRENQFLQSLVKQRLVEGRLDELVFNPIKNQIVPEALATFQEIGYQCIHDDREKRPTAQHVLVQLQKALELQVKGVPGLQEFLEMIINLGHMLRCQDEKLGG